jgi:hypothetical protein
MLRMLEISNHRTEMFRTLDSCVGQTDVHSVTASLGSYLLNPKWRYMLIETGGSFFK